MNRRKFLSLLVGATAVHVLPIPEFLSQKFHIGDKRGFKEELSKLVKDLNTALVPTGTGLVQGAALQVEDLSVVMSTVTFDDTKIKLWKRDV